MTAAHRQIVSNSRSFPCQQFAAAAATFGVPDTEEDMALCGGDGGNLWSLQPLASACEAGVRYGWSRVLVLPRASCTSIAAALAVSLTAATSAQTITVTTLNDLVDFVAPQQVANLPGADGVVSFREACLASSNTAGPQTIHFAIPQSQWWLYNDRAILRQENGIFAINGDETTIDFSTQTNVTGDTNPNGGEVGIYGLEPNAWGIAAIYINADNCVVKGLDRVMQRGYGVRITGNNNRVIGCTISGSLYAGVHVQGYVGDPAMGNIIGGTDPGESNVLSGGNAGVRVDGPTDNTVVIGNTIVGSPFAGVQVRGAYCCPDYTPYNTRIGGPSVAERNWIADNGQYGEEGFPEGDQVEVEWAVNTTVEGNYIGTTQGGDARYPGAHGTSGVSIRESDMTIVRDNLISGIRKDGVNHAAGQVFGSGIAVLGPNTGIDIKGNLIGTDLSGENPVPNLNGITFAWFQGYASGGLIGGAAVGDANTIAFSERSGVRIDSGVNGVTIARNSIHSSGLLGIDLLAGSGGGVTPNDPGDADTGGNGLQNFPVLTSAEAGGGTTAVQGTFNSTANSAFTLEFFAGAECNPSGYGEGEHFLGSTNVVTDASGNATIDVVLPMSIMANGVVTATATGATGDTSEFSACIGVTGGQVLGDISGDGWVGVPDLLMVINGWGSCGELCPADLTGDGTVGVPDLLVVINNWSN